MLLPEIGDPGQRRRDLRARLAAGQPLIVPGVPNALGARLAELAGFEACYATGAGIANTEFAMPDVGLVTQSEVVEQAARIGSATALPLIVDADTGYGGPMSVVRTVRLLEAAGAASIQIEDQKEPKRCGHFDRHELIGTREMQAKIDAALRARADEATLIIARTDARDAAGLDEAIARGRAYLDAGAECLFVEAPRSPDELRRVGAELGRVPLVANVVEGGRTPQLSAAEFGALGFSVILYANTLLRSMAKAGLEMLEHLRAHGETASVAGRLIGWDQRQAIVRLPAYEELDASFHDRWA